MPELAFARRHAVFVQIGRNRRQRLCTRRAGGTDVRLDGGGIGDGFAVMPGGDARAVQPQLDATGLCGGEGCFGPLRDHLAFVFGERGHHMQHEPAGMGHIDGDKVRRALHQVGDEGDVAGETVELGDQQGRLVPAARLQGERELRAVVFAAGLDLKAINLAMPLSAAKIIREILFVPPSMRVIDLLARMQATRIHLALVIDEYGGTDGLISIEDIVEQIVGEIADEHDEDELPGVVRQPDDSYIADARTPLEDVVAIVGSDFDVGDAAEEVDTIGGYLVTRAGRLPVRGEIVPGPGLFEFEVLDADPRRVKRIRIVRLKERRDRPREQQRKRQEPDAVLAGATPTQLATDDTPKDDGPAAAAPADTRRP